MVTVKELLEQLEAAIRKKELEPITTLLDSDAGKQLSPDNIGMLLHTATRYFDSKCFQALLARSNINLISQNQLGWTAAHTAAYMGNIDAITLLGEHYLSTRKEVGFGLATANAVVTLFPGRTEPVPNCLPIAIAKLKGAEACAQKIEEYQTMFTHNLKTLPPILIAAMSGQEDMVTSLKTKDVSSQILTTHRMNGGISLLMWATANNLKELVSYYLRLEETKVLVNVPNDAGQSPLLMAACRGFSEIYGMLKGAQADIELLLTYTFSGGNNIFHFVMQSGSTEILNFLLTLKELHPLLDKPNGQGLSPILFAAFNRQEPYIKAFREAQVLSKLAEFRNAEGDSVLMIAINNELTEVANDFLTFEETKSLKDVPNKQGIPPIVQAATLGLAETVKGVNRAGIPLITLKEFRNANGASALMLAVGQKTNKGITFLINLEETKSLLNERNNLQQSPLLLAACSEAIDRFELLNTAGADRAILTSYSFEDGSNILQFAMKNNLLKLVSLLTAEEIAVLSEQEKKVKLEANATQNVEDPSNQVSADLLDQLFSATSTLSIQETSRQQPNASLSSAPALTFNPILEPKPSINTGTIADIDENAKPEATAISPSI